jgi:two-component system nitrogen regulation sensor histidine kinase NtrY
MRRWSLESRIALLVAASGGLVLLLWAVAMLVPESAGVADGWWWAIAAALLGIGAWRLRKLVLGPVQSLTNVLEAIRFQDYSLRARRDRGGVMSELATEINLLADDLRLRAHQEQESRALLEKVMQEIDLPLFAFDAASRLVIANPAAENLLASQLSVGSSATALGVQALLEHSSGQPLNLSLPGGSGRFVIRHRPFRMDGQPHVLLVLAEVSGALRIERQEAWQELVRVLGHEINNSLAPIKSIAETLRSMVLRRDHQQHIDELNFGLERIAERAHALGRFVGGYAALARLPEPILQPLALSALAGRVAAMEPRVSVQLDGPEVEIQADPDQLEQALINLVKNAADSLDVQNGLKERGGEGSGQGLTHDLVKLQWRQDGDGILIEVLDNGPGPPDSENLFVPFFTTKPGGSGIGLLLARRITEMHEGWLTLEPRADGERGACARLWLPG